MSNLRDEISDYIMNHVTINPDTRFADLTWDQTNHAADDIIALFRGRMLSDAAVEAAVLGSFRWEVRNVPGMPYTEDQYESFKRENVNWLSNVRSELTAALDAALGEDTTS